MSASEKWRGVTIPSADVPSIVPVVIALGDAGLLASTEAPANIKNYHLALRNGLAFQKTEN
jgi:hypothetical protein